MPKVFTSDSQKSGELGEGVAVKFLMKHGYAILDRNYTKKWGEIDIVAQKDNRLHFIEVKSVKREALPEKEELDAYRPEDNMHAWKLQRLARTVQTYLLSKKGADEEDWQIDLIVVYLNQKTRQARVKVVSNIIL